MVTLSLFATATDSRVDADNGILRGVRVISKGEARGHSFLGEPIIVDDQTITEVVAAAAGFSDGVPVKLAHGTDIEELVGSIRDIVNDGDCARGDLYLLKSHESYATIIEMAQTMPSNFGISISFMNAPEPVKGNDMEPDGNEDDTDSSLRNLVADDIVAYAARVAELYSADLVQAPACNPSLFSTPMSEPATTPEVPAETPEVAVEEPAVTPETAVSEEAPVEQVEVIEIKEELQVDGPAGTQNDPEGGKEVSGPEGTQNLPEGSVPLPAPVVTESDKEEKPFIPAPAELSRNWTALTTDFEATKTELSRVTTELSAVRSDLEAARGEIAKRDTELTDLRYLHRAVLSVMNLGASIEIPEINEAGPSKTILEQYEEMSAGPERLAFFQANRREIERSLAAKLN